MKDLVSRAVIAALMACWMILTVLLLTTEAGSMSVSTPTPHPVAAPPPLPPAIRGPLPADVFGTYLDTDILPADGFDFPVGDPDGGGGYTDLATGKSYDGWYVSVRFGAWYSYGLHPGEDWNGVGGGNTDLGQPVHAVAAGKVVFSRDCGQPSGGVVMIEHLYYRNGDKRRVMSVYRHLDAMRVERGQTVRRRQILGALGRDPQGKFHAHLHFEMRRDLDLHPTYWPSAHGKGGDWLRAHYLNPSAFIRGHRHLFIPPREPHLVLVDSATRRMHLYRRGRLQARFAIGFSRRPGSSRSHEHRFAPRGMYFVVERHEHRLAINYPNRFDAAGARRNGLLSHCQEADVRGAWQARHPTPGDTVLGSGAAITAVPATSGPAPVPAPGLIVMGEQDLARLYRQVPAHTMVVIF